MKTIGLLGGMSWESSIEYYRIINEETRRKLGGLHSAKCIMSSVDFAEIEILQNEGKWDQAARLLSVCAREVENGGADFLLICTNTMHKVAPEIQSHINIPLLHIADATAQRIKKENIDTIALLGTRFTMEEDFYKGRLIRNFGLKVMVPDSKEQEVINRVIYEELCRGKIVPSSKKAYIEIMDRLVDQGAKGIILGCTEIGLLVNQADNPMPMFDTAKIHAEAAVEFALKPD